MRTSFAMLAFILVSAGACSLLGVEEEQEDGAAASLDREAGELALVTIVRAPDGSCTVRWDGQPIAESAVQDRAFQVMEGHIQQLGGPQNITNELRAVFEAPQDAPYGCFMRPLRSLANVGFSQIALRFAGRGPGADRIMRVHYASDNQTLRPYAVLDLRADGTVLWNEQPIAPAQLREFMTNTIVVPADVGITDGTVVIFPERSATFAQLHELVGTTMERDSPVLLQPPRDEPDEAPATGNSQAPTP